MCVSWRLCRVAPHTVTEVWAFSSLAPCNSWMLTSNSLMLTSKSFFPKLMHVCAECETGVKFLSYYIKILNSFQLCSNILLIWNYLGWWCCSCDVFSLNNVRFIRRDGLFDWTWERSCLHENLTISKSLSLLSTRNLFHESLKRPWILQNPANVCPGMAVPSQPYWLLCRFLIFDNSYFKVLAVKCHSSAYSCFGKSVFPSTGCRDSPVLLSFC